MLVGIVVVGKDTGVRRAERDDAGAGEGGRVNQVGGAELPGVVKPSASTMRPSASVLMISMVLPDLAVMTSPGLYAVPRGHVFCRADNGDDLHLRLESGDGAHGSDHGGAAGHVVLHLLHALGGLDGDAAGVKGNALANQSENRLRWCPFRLIGHNDERRRLCRSLGDGPECAHLLFVQFVCAEYLALDAGFLAHLCCPFAKDRRSHLVAGLIDQGAGKVLRFAENDAFGVSSADLGLVGAGRAEDGEILDALVLAV